MQNENQPNTLPAHPLAELLNFGKPDERNIMLDIETLGTTAGSVILTVGAVEFSNLGVCRRFYVRISLEDSLKLGLKVDADTMQWWLKQNEHVRNEAFGITNPHSVTKVTAALDWIREFFNKDDFAKDTEKVFLWGNGASFDPVLLEVYFRKFGFNAPWEFRHIRCYRTVSALFPMVPKRSRVNIHNALSDAEAQVQRLIDIRAFVQEYVNALYTVTVDYAEGKRTEVKPKPF